MMAYYNEIEPMAVHVLRQLIADGLIAPGDVDDRSIKDVKPDDLKGYTQCHFFAGGGLWSVAARLAGWPDTRPLWTGSCPCQPFSVAGKGGGEDDPRHLWPDLFRLWRAVRPPILVGEQVAGKAGYDWFNGVSADLAGEGAISRVVDIPACAVDAPHIRQRLYWVAVADADSGGRGGRTETPERGEVERIAFEWSAAVNLGNATSNGRQQGKPATSIMGYRDQPAAAYGRNGSFWAGAEWIICHDGKARRTQPRLCDVAHGNAGEMGRCYDVGSLADEEEQVIEAIVSGSLLVPSFPRRADAWKITGNAIVPDLAAQVLGALLDCYPEQVWRDE